MTGTDLVSGAPHAAFPHHDFAWFPFTTTGLVSIPLGFFLGWLGTRLPDRGDAAEQRRRYEAVEGLILAGAVPQVTRTDRAGSRPRASGSSR